MRCNDNVPRAAARGFLFAWLGCGAFIEAPPNETRVRLGWKTGYAEADITPAIGEAMMSGFGRERYAAGMVSPLRAQAVVLEDGMGDRAAIVTSDVLGYSRVLVDAFRHSIELKYGIAPSSVAFPCSHTHCGPAVNFGLNFAVGGLSVWYLARLETQLVDLVGEAVKSLSPSEVEFGETSAQIGMNRRRVTADGVRSGPNPDGVYDRHTPLLRITRRRSPRRVVLVNHACHPTSTGAYHKWSPDWPGAMRRYIESRVDDSRALFAKGCGADANVVYRDRATGEYAFSRDPARSRRAGVRLGRQVVKSLEQGTFVSLTPKLRTTIASGTLSLKRARSRSATRDLALSGDTASHLTWWARQSVAYPDRRRSVEYDVQAWRLGEFTQFWLEGEVCADLGLAARALVDGPVATAGYTNACPGYISSARLIREGGYEGDTSHMAYFLPAPFAEKSEKEFLMLCRKALAGLRRS